MAFKARLVRTSLALCLVTFGLPAFADQVSITDKARAHFSAGVNYLQDPDGARYEEAYREFRAAYAESPSWKILGNLGLTAMKLERDGEAIESWEKYLAEGGQEIEPEERAQVERDLQTIKASLVKITIESVPPGATIIDERVPNRGTPVVNRYGPVEGPLELGIRPGHHRITAQLAGYEPQTWEFDARTGSAETHRFELRQVGATPAAAGGTLAIGADSGAGAHRPVPTSVYIGLAATGVLAAGAAVTGILATSKRSEFDDANTGANPSSAEALREDGQQLNLITDILLGGAVVAGAVTAVLYFTRPEVTPARDTTAVRVSPALGARGGALMLSGSF